MPINQHHDRYLGLLFERTGLDGHPSPMMLDRLERAITDRDDLETYLNALLDVIERSRYPSPQLLARASRLVAVLVVADVHERDLARAA